jgi:hypothetical protein
LYDSQKTFKGDDVLGYTIGVYQESINKEFNEYLVNFTYFIEIMGAYGFMPMSPVKEILPIDSFESIYKRGGYTLSEQEQKISFLNNYFIFQKVRQVSSSYVHNKYTQGEQVQFIVGKPEKLNKKVVIR